MRVSRPLIETLYRTKTPRAIPWRQESFELSLGEQTVDGELGYYVRETHCVCDGDVSRMLRVQYTLSPRKGFATIEEAQARYHSQRLIRARRGFVHSFAPRYDSTRKNKYVLIAIAPRPSQESQPIPGDTDAPS